MIRLLLVGGVVAAAATHSAGDETRLKRDAHPNVIKNSDFQRGKLGDLPEAWGCAAARPVLMPVFRLEEKDGKKVLAASGGGNDVCTGYVFQSVPVNLGTTYLYRTLFRMSDGLDPNKNLLFRCVRPGVKNGIFRFRKLENGLVEGREKIHFPGEGVGQAEIQLFFRYSAGGKVWVQEISLTETTPIEPRWVKVACTQGKTDLQSCAKVLEIAGLADADIALLPEYMQGGFVPEALPGPSSDLMSMMAKKYRMYVGGGIVRQCDKADPVFNTALLYDREGKLVGMYDKVHPYSPENNEQGITPGRKVPVFQTDFGKVGFAICYDIWFPDVCELLALKGAEIVLFPNAGHQPEVLYARSMDNCVRIVNSAWNLPYSIHDTLGRNILKCEAYRTSPSPNMKTFKDISQTDVPGSHVKVLMASLDLNCSPSPAYNGGTMMSAPGGKRNRREQLDDLYEEIRKENQRWWD
jgi:predicted amidohydrolase